MRRLIALALFAAPAMASPAEDALRAHGDRWNAAYSAADWIALRALYADDAWLMTDKAPAAKGMHHVYLGGLLEHSLALVRLVRVVVPHVAGAPAAPHDT